MTRNHGEEWVAYINRLAGTTNLEMAGAANALAGTTGLEAVGALNTHLGTVGKELGYLLDHLEGGGGEPEPEVPETLTNLHAWYKADGTLWQDSARTTPATANNDPVGAWDDASGNGGHALQSTAGLRPALNTSGPNSKPAVLANSDWLLATGLTGWTGGVTVFVVANGAGATPSSDYWIDFRSDRDDVALLAGFEGSGMVEWFANPRVNVGTVHATDWAIYEFVDPGDGSVGSAIGLKNGTVTEALTSINKTFGTVIALFANETGISPAVANFAEVIIYKEGKSSGDRTAVRSYLGTKYGITVT